MAITKISIFNTALKNLGVTKTVLDNNSPDKNREVLETYYEICLRQVLTDYDWVFASTFRTLTPCENKPLDANYQYAYDYPNDVLAPREIYDIDLPSNQNIHNDDINYFAIANYEGKSQIWCNTKNAILRYTAFIENPVKFSNEFVIALSWLLAHFSAPSIVGSRTQYVDCYQEYNDWCDKGKTLDANKEKRYVEEYVDYIEARN